MTYTVEVTLEKPATDKEMEKSDYYPRHVCKEFSAADAEEVKSLIDEYLPALKPKKEAQEFDEAFKEATGEEPSS